MAEKDQAEDNDEKTRGVCDNPDGCLMLQRH